MTENQSLQISENELSILEVLWEMDRPISAFSIQEALKNRPGLGRTTVRNTLTRLTAKNLVLVENRDPLTFAANLSQEDYTWGLLESVLNRVYDGDAKKLVMALHDHRKITIIELEHIIRSLF